MSISASIRPLRSARFSTALAVEFYKLRRSLALLLACIAPLLIAVFMFFNILQLKQPMSWFMALQGCAGIWAFFMLPMSLTALTALLAHTEHSVQSWDMLRALPRPRWQLYAAKVVCTLAVVAAMSGLLVLYSLLAVHLAGWWKPAIAATGALGLSTYLLLLARIFAASTLMIAVQLWVALRYSSFVPALALGIGGTFVAVVATSAKIGMLLPWQLPVNQMASDPQRANITLFLGTVGGVCVLAAMMWRLGRRELVG